METATVYFVDKASIVRKIWGRSDTILFIFAGAAAEFALNKAVDWLYFTGKLPADPIGRLFSTVAYARQIVFSRQQDALAAIDRITSIHAAVEENRNAKIPGWAYRDVLFMLIFYSIASFELLERKLTEQEKAELYDVFMRIGTRMNLKELPGNFEKWKIKHLEHVQAHLVESNYTIDLFKQYHKHLGSFRYRILLETQKLIVPEIVKDLLHFSNIKWLQWIMPLYRFSYKIKLDGLIKAIILPPKYKAEIKMLDIKSGAF